MTEQTTADSELVARANGGDAGAFSALLERHYDTIFRIALRSLANRQDAEDITQDICVSLARKIASFKGKSRFSTWLYQITMNACRDYRRRAHTRERSHAEYHEISMLRDQLQKQRAKDAEWAYAAIDTLSDSLRETALLVVAEGLNHAEAGEVLGISESTVSWRMLKIREELSLLAKTEAAI